MWILLPFHLFNAILILALVALLCCCEAKDRTEIAQKIQAMFGSRTPETIIEEYEEEREEEIEESDSKIDKLD